MDFSTASRPSELSSERYLSMIGEAKEREEHAFPSLTSQEKEYETYNIQHYTCPFRLLISIPTKNHHKVYRIVPCGKCFYCCLKKEQTFAAKMNIRLAPYPRKYFLTVTQSPENYEIAPTKNLRRFLRQLEYRFGKFYYYGINELGPNTFRSHSHILVGFREEVTPDVLEDVIKKLLPDDIVTIDPITDGAIKYCASYCKKLFSPFEIRRFYRKSIEQPITSVEDKYLDLEEKLGYLTQLEKTLINGTPSYEKWEEPIENRVYEPSSPSTLQPPTKQEFLDYQKRLSEAYSNYSLKKIIGKVSD